MKSKFKKLLATALVLCLVLALLPAAAFAEVKYTITFNNDSGGTFTDGKYNYGQIRVNNADYNTEGYAENTEITLKAVPDDGYGLAVFEVTVGGVKQNVTNDTCTFKLTDDVVVKAAFRELHNVSVYDDEEGIQSIIVDPTVAAKDMTVNVTVTPKAGYKVTEIFYTTTGNEHKTIAVNSNTGSFTMPAKDVTVSAVATAMTTYAITPTKTGEGTVTTDRPNGTYAGDTVKVTAQAAAGAILKEIKVYNTNTPSETVAFDYENASFTMPAFAVTVEAVFEAFTPPVTDTYTITCVDYSTYGSFTSDKTTAQEGDVVTISVKPNWGYRVDEIYYMTSTSGIIPPGQDFSYIGDNKWTFAMPDSDVWVYVTYEPYFPGQDFYPITVSNPGSHCVVTVPENGYYGSEVTVKLSNFDTGYTLSYLKVDGVYVKPYAYNGYLGYTFKMPSHSVAIEVGTTNVSGKYYIDTSYDSTLGGVEVWVNNNYVNNWHQGSWADYKDSVSFKVKPYYSDDVVSVSVVGKRTGWNYSYDYNSYSGWYTFTMPNEDVTINVDFRSGVHKVYVDKVTDGKLTVSDDWAKYGQIVYITAVPDYGCTLSSLSVRTATGDSVHVYNAQKADTYYFYMPDQYVSVSAVFTGKYTSLPFNDVSYGDWYYDAVQFVYSKGIMDGVDYYKFAPNGTITRGMIVTMLWRMAGEPFEMPVTSFTDVEIGRYYTTAVAWACRNGIADGMGESTFGPNDAITREELVTLLYRYAQYFGHSCIGTSIEGFADAGSVSSYAYNAMCWAYKAGVVTGTTGSRLNPQGTASRAEAAQMIMSFYSFLNS